MLASCSSSGGSATGGSGGGGGGTTGTGGQATTGTGGSASGGASGSGSGGSGGGQAVGTSGGTVAQAGVTLAIPTSALSASTVITVATTPPPSGYTLASEAYQFGPSGTTFAQPVAVTIPLTSATPGVHLFWSNASGGFDDVGGTVSGSSLTANVTHFSIGFCAIPQLSGAGGSSATGGASGSGGQAGGGGQAGAAATGGVSGTGGGGPGTGGSSVGGTKGTGGTGTGTGGSAGTTGAGGGAGASGATDAGLSGDAAASLCKTFPLNLPFASVSNVDAGIAPDSSAYAGGTIASGRYYLTSVTHYGAGSYTGSKQVQYTFDATAKTIVTGEFVPIVGGSQYVGMTYTELNANTLRVTVVCNSGTTPSGTFDMYYTVNGSQITLTAVGSSDVSVL
ncbi:MAG TPA: hypothetical protein VLA79_00340 [Polyangia bacterium]|nr:hypothetical protein [Polyangia bacterium]